MEETPRERSEASSTGGDSAAKGSDGAEWRGPPRAVGVEDESATDAGRSELPHSGGAAPAVDAKGASPAARGTADVEISFADDGAASGLSAKSGDHPASGSRRSIKTSLQGTTRQRNKALEQGEREFGNVEAETWMRTCSSYAVLAVVVAVALVGIAGTSATVLLVNQSDARDLELAKSDGEGSAKLLAVTVERSLRRQVADLYLMASTLQVQPNGVIDRWTHQTDRFYDVFEGVSISAAIRYLPGDMRDQWESAMSEYAGRTVTMQNATGGPAEPRDFYYVMQHVTPPTPLLDYKEISIFQDQVAVVNAAMASNRVQVSAPTPLLTGALGYLAYVKVNGTDDGSSTWGALVYSCPIADLLEGALGDSRGPVHPNAAELSVSVTDITTSNHHLVFQNVAAGSDAFTLGSYRIQYAQRLLSLEVWTTTEFVQARLSSASSAVLVAGIVVTVLLAVFAVITACLVDFLSRRAASRAVAAAELAHTRVLSYVLHEMRNPLHAMSGFLSASTKLVKVSTDRARKSLAENLQSAVSQTYHMQAVLDDVLDIRALRAGDFTVAPRLVSVASIIRDTGFQFASLLGDDVKLISTVDSSVPEWVSIDPTRVRQILANALHNAYKATSNGTILLSSCSFPHGVDSSNVWLAFAIANSNLKGLPDGVSQWAQGEHRLAAEVLPASVLQGVTTWLTALEGRMDCTTPRRPLSPKTRLDAGKEAARHVRGVKSTNIGLSLCSRIAVKMGGRVLLDQDAGSGLTRFVLIVPGAVGENPLPTTTSPSNASDLSRPRSRGRGSADGKAESKSDSMVGTGQHVLFVDDERVMRMLGRRMCRSVGARVTVCEDGADVFDVMKDDPSITMVLMDIVMHRSDGRKVCSELRSLGYTIPIVAVTANVAPANIAEYKECGFNGMLGKPYDADDISTLVHHLGSAPGEWWSNSRLT